MKPRAKPASLALASAFAASLLPGCAGRIDFSSPSPLGEGVRGKYWRAPVFVDAPLYLPAALADPVALRAFDVASNGKQAQLVANWHDSSESQFKGYARLYSDGSGWASLGPAFGQVAALSGGVDIGFPTVAAGPGGIFAATFFAASAGTAAVSASFNGSSWLPYAQANTAIRPDLLSATSVASAPGAVSAMDSLGRGYLFAIDNQGATAHVRGTTWQQANTNGFDAAFQDLSAANARDDSALTARFDGSKNVCVTYETASGPDLVATCLDVFANATHDFSSASATARITTLSDDAVAGHATATDGAGSLMAVYYQLSGTEYHVYARLGTAGAWTASAKRIDLGLSENYVAPHPDSTDAAYIQGARPGVAYVGGGRYLAAWVGVNTVATASSPKSTAVIYALYDPAKGGWSAASIVSGSVDPFLATPHAQSLDVFGNANGNAGFALSKLHTTAAIPPYAATSPDIYPESVGARVLQVARWQKEDGWLAVTTLGNVCYSESSALTALPDDTDDSCKHRPRGVILDSGNTLVFFQDRDENADGTSPGNRRLAVAQFN